MSFFEFQNSHLTISRRHEVPRRLDQISPEVYLKSYRDMVEARIELGRYLEWYNGERKHSSLGYKTPDAVYSTRKTGNHEAA